MKIHVPTGDAANMNDVEQLNARLTLELEQLALQNQMLRMGLPGSMSMGTPPGLSPAGTPVASRPASPGPMSHQIMMQHHSLALQNQTLVQENQALRLGAQFLGNSGFSRGGFSEASVCGARFSNLSGSRGSRSGFSEFGARKFDGLKSGSTSPGSRGRSPVSSAPSSRNSSPGLTSGPSSRASSPVPSQNTVDPSTATTVIMRKLPKTLSRDGIVALMDEKGFRGSYDLVYAPVDFATRSGLGYVFVNLVSPEAAKSFVDAFNGFSDWPSVSSKVCEVSWSCELQGLDAHVQRYRDSPVLHESVPDIFRPVLFKDGERIAFPPPTKVIKQPRLRASRQKLKSSRRFGAGEGEGEAPEVEMA
jgi:hypothetical protein